MINYHRLVEHGWSWKLDGVYCRVITLSKITNAIKARFDSKDTRDQAYLLMRNPQIIQLIVVWILVSMIMDPDV